MAEKFLFADQETTNEKNKRYNLLAARDLPKEAGKDKIHRQNPTIQTVFYTVDIKTNRFVCEWSCFFK
jgi:hypothetical protein